MVPGRGSRPPLYAYQGLFKLSRRLLWVPVIAVTLVVGLVGGAFADQAFPDIVPALVPGSPGRVDYAAYMEAVRIIEAHYYTTRLDSSKLTAGSINGLVGALGDPFSRYLTPAEYRRQLESYSGQLTGIGIYVDFSGPMPAITGLIPAGPAERAGLKAGDLIVAVNGNPTRGVPSDKVTAEIEGRAGTKVSLTIQRGATRFSVTVTRRKLTVPSVATWRFPGGILYIRIFNFQDTTAGELATQLKSGLPARGLVLDLRGNPGGFIDQARSVVSQFLPSGVVFELRTRTGGIQKEGVTGDSHPATKQPMIVLVDRNTASAAEITAGALKVRGRARLVGEKTFGKGEVEEDFPLSDGGDLHLTVEQWFLPDGKSVQHVGLVPDIKVSLGSGQMFDVVDPSAGHASDAPLNEALRLLGGS